MKAYPAGRYTDPNYPDEMHERHSMPSPAAASKGEAKPQPTPEPVEGFSDVEPPLTEPDKSNAPAIFNAFPVRREGLATLTTNTP